MLDKLRAMYAWLMVQFDIAMDTSLFLAEQKAAPVREAIDDNVESAVVRQMAQGAVTTLVVVGATLIVGIIVYSKIQESTPAPENSDLNNSSQSVTDTVASSFDLGSVLPIVIIAGAILFFLRGFGGGGMPGGRR